MSNTGPQNDEVGRHAVRDPHGPEPFEILKAPSEIEGGNRRGVPSYGDIKSEDSVGSATRSAGACAACRADQKGLKRGLS
jgi:hypothetical protein